MPRRIKPRQSVTRDVVIVNRQGLHARPIAQLVEIAAKSQSTLRVACDDREVDGRSILQLMTLCAGQGAQLRLSADGPDAERLVAALEALIANRFGEE